MLVRSLEALAVNDGGAALVVFLLGDPHLLEGRERCQDGATDPDGVFTLRRSNDLDLHRGRGEGSDFLLHTIGDTRVHGGTTRLDNSQQIGQRRFWVPETYHDDVAVQILTNINIALHDGVEGGHVDAAGFETENRWLEEGLRSSESLVADGDHLTVGKFVGFLQAGALRSGLDLLFEIKGDVAELLLDVAHDFSLGGGGEGVAALGQDLHEVIGQITTSHIHTGNGVGKSETFVDGDNVGHTIARVEDDASRATGGVERQDGLDGDVECRCVERLKDDLCHLFSVGLGVDGGFR
jgi:hypothetical protein